MFGRYTQQQIEDNIKYTQECNKIYHNFRIAEVRETEVKEAAIPIFFSILPFMMVICIIIGIIRIYVYGDMDGSPKLIFIYLGFFSVFLCVSALIWIIFILKTRTPKKDLKYHRYMYRDSTGLYCIFTIEENDFIITQIVNCDEMTMFDGYTKEKINWGKFERYSGLAQFVISPSKVFSDTDQSSIHTKKKMKKKIVRGDTVIYKFYGGQGVMIGEPNSHCLKIKDGQIQYAVAHYMRKNIYQGYSHWYSRHNYSRINDEEIKIVFSPELVQAAKKKKFMLPKPSTNIIYEEV